MKEKSIKLNLFMNALLTCSSFIFPLITFPYVSQILLADGNGKINFANSVINYFMLIAALGLPFYGIRACAAVRDDRRELSRTVCELFILSTITTIISLVLLAASILLVPKFYDYKILLFILSSTIWLKSIGMEWLFQALEEYSYITIRSIIFKFLGLVLMFMFVHEHDDYLIYAVITVISGSGSYVLNFLRIRSFVDIVPLCECDVIRHVKPVLSCFILSAAWSLYGNADAVMLGFLSTDAQNGYFAAAVKIRQILLQCMLALGTVLLPRLSNYYSNNRKADFYRLLKKNSSFLFVAGFAITAFCLLNAKPIIILLSGDEFLPAIPAMQIMMVFIIFNGISTMLGDNVLLTQGKEIVTTIATLIGFVILFLIELVVIPIYGVIGAAIGTSIGTVVTVFIEVVYLRRDIALLFDFVSALKCAVSAFISSLLILWFSSLAVGSEFSVLVQLFTRAVLFFGIYLTLLLLMRENFTCETLQSLIKHRAV